MTKQRVAVLISGRGSNMQALVRAARAPDYPAEIVAVISNRPGAAGLAFARDNGIPAEAIDHKAYPDREAFEAALHQSLLRHRAELVACAGFMRILTPGFTRRWAGRMLNIHPSLLPAYKGLHTHEQALADKATRHGASVHFVSEELDGGQVIAQAAVPVMEGDTAETLAARVLNVEHPLYVKALELVASGKVQFKTSS
ncbi:MAG: phosphoribosylglycinamide formyltransferase [Proteobacteria bacterium]|nr:phosphoribosylglycinamide formyltransferase [Pseudomonadota bacterium]